MVTKQSERREDEELRLPRIGAAAYQALGNPLNGLEIPAGSHTEKTNGIQNMVAI